MADWKREIEELHEVFEEYFLGAANNLDRVEAALGDDFSFVGPDGNTASRAETLQALEAGHAHSTTLKITITDARLLFEDGNTVVATYVENHELTDRANHRLSTVIFTRDAAGPNGLRWRRVHETWLN